MSKVNNLRLDEMNWDRHVSPGSTVSMAALMLRQQRMEDGVSRCPEPACRGTWQIPNFEVWINWYDNYTMAHALN